MRQMSGRSSMPFSIFCVAAALWRMLPRDFPPYSTVYMYFKQWKDDGTWEKVHDILRDRIRSDNGRKKSPSAAMVDSQSVKTTEKGALAAMTQARK